MRNRTGFCAKFDKRDEHLATGAVPRDPAGLSPVPQITQVGAFRITLLSLCRIGWNADGPAAGQHRWRAFGGRSYTAGAAESLLAGGAKVAPGVQPAISIEASHSSTAA